MKDVLTYHEHGLDLGDVIVGGLGSLFAKIGLEFSSNLSPAYWTPYESGNETGNLELGAVPVLLPLPPIGGCFLLENCGPGLHVLWLGSNGNDFHPRGAEKMAERTGRVIPPRMTAPLARKKQLGVL
ncbi:MAG TPA: hypothetical protein VHM93_05025 [Candidatus Acidoferrum sp.]|jgi:hypothetical protein|nr:hypothetical protein [Candidatus Acidoferrum sp.]